MNIIATERIGVVKRSTLIQDFGLEKEQAHPFKGGMVVMVDDESGEKLIEAGYATCVTVTEEPIFSEPESENE